MGWPVVVEEPSSEQPSSSSASPTRGTWPRRWNSVPRPGIDEAGGSPSTEHVSSLVWSLKSLKGMRNKFTKRATDLFIALCELKDYVELNYTGFSKILKKYDKVTANKLRRQYMATKVDMALPFRPQTKDGLNHMIDRVVGIYARIHTDGKLGLALTELKGYLRERIIWERNTIWKDMIEQERRRETIGLRPKAAVAKEEQIKKREITICDRKLVIPPISTQLLKIFICLAVFIFFLLYPSFETLEQRYCFAILIFASMLWASEALPLFITAILVPFLVVIFRVLRVPATGPDGHPEYHRLPAKDAAKKIFSDMFGPVVMLLLGGFSLAAALSKHNIAKGLASFVLGKAGSKPQWVLLANMFVSTFASMWISNVAAPVLCFSLITPILRNLPQKSPYARCLIMGIAMAANVGGMASPISSPQNIIAIGTMDPEPSWLEWFSVALPVVITIDLIIWALLLFMYKPSPQEGAAPPELFGHSYFAEHPLTRSQWYIIAVSILTIILWCTESAVEGVVGDMGVIAIFPIIAFYGTGMLTKDDWNSMLWSVVMLAMGGIALGKAVDSSGLLAEIANGLTPHLEGLSPFACLALFSGLVLVVTTFISHTVGALIILPIILKVGSGLPEPRPNTMVMAAALMCSGAMGLPVSSFPNMNAISLEDRTGTPWVHVSDFLRVGIPSSFVAWVIILTIGYPIMGVLGIR
ncbi:divalent anion:Na+ symporter (DASS) family transporter [Spizellomyces punctatus DAOM BR117]|uniref:Divalent anion:Na+ symporter (DASS) family transporter n=1 Tax=Spizellomyces punctatus (strain DAOM BR117) TaxID=645134 RepID=A0A0L0H409_SPIPD|nr:divalent anion:Na+ symporter (DASS) family transporter [Spizellomyces punctatus DAOM BR117]KNC96220.1 divalent anion:Na+ symporter (DASS) family transporter [Spizellomyces punctatus DAOM BR117]|eukprot:XP_016604260.1 divalent anion:Na+ symporter (DASS) family transporter [Spizellomyces punctatus DAOM BR117]